MNRKNIINVNSFQAIDMECCKYTSDPLIEFMVERSGRGYDDHGVIMKIVMPINEFLEMLKYTKRLVNRYRANAEAISKNLMDAIKE